MIKSAVVSECGNYRYELRRVWDESLPPLLFIALNPSTGDFSVKDNSTVRVCMNFARRWGYGGMLLANLFAYSSTDKSALFKVKDPVGPRNDSYIRQLSKEAALTVCAWSDTGGYMERDIKVLKMLKDPHPHCLVKLKSGRPGHPLYKRRELTPTLLLL